MHAHEWREVRALRLQALRDEAAPIAFIDNVEDASSRPDEFWQQRVALASVQAGSDAGARQFIAVTEAGAWIGSVTVLLERAGEQDYEGSVIERSGGGIVGVYLDPAFRGRGIIQSLVASALDWIRERRLDHARLYVHTDNLPAQKAYAKAGFRPTDRVIGPEIEMARDL